MAMTFGWKADSRYSVGAQIAADRLNAIRSSAGEITPRAVVEDARHGNSPLHPCFEWDDGKAADAHRLQQARHMIGSLVVVKIDDAPVIRETRAFLHVTTDSTRYEPVEVVVNTPDLRAEVLGRAKAEIQRWRDRYAAYADFGTVVSAIDELLAGEQPASVPGPVRRGGAGMAGRG